MVEQDSQAQKNWAMACIQAGRFAEAKAIYTEICRARPGDADAWFMLSAINGYLGLMGEAVRCGRQAVAIRPDYVEAHYNLGQAYKRLNKSPEAEASFRAAVRLRPDYAEAWDNLGYILQEQGKKDEAMACYQEALRLRPDFTGTRYLLAALGGHAPPPQAPPDYVRGLFDGYADHFDKHLTEALEYRIPEFLNQAVRRVITGNERELDVLDLGCGTGLCGVLFRDLARTLAGVDLAPRMIEKARTRNLYDKLLVGDVVLPLEAPGAAYDLVLAADVFIYIGDLARVFQLSKAALKPGGLFAFSVEAAPQDTTYLLRATNRYAHSEGYIRDLARTSDLAEVSCDRAVLRKQGGAPVEGYIFVLRRES